MPSLSNAREEMFCRYIVKGETQINAFTKSGYRHNYGNASAKASEQHIKDRIAELLAEKDKEIVETLEVSRNLAPGSVSELQLTEAWVLQNLMLTAQQAKKAGQYAPAKGALELIGEYLGMWGTKKGKSNDGPSITEELKKKRSKLNLADFAAKINNQLENKEVEEEIDNVDTPTKDTDTESLSESEES